MEDKWQSDNQRIRNKHTSSNSNHTAIEEEKMDGEPEMLDDAAAIVANMALAHEMIMTDNFHLTHVTELKDDRWG